LAKKGGLNPFLAWDLQKRTNLEALAAGASTTQKRKHWVPGNESIFIDRKMRVFRAAKSGIKPVWQGVESSFAIFKKTAKLPSFVSGILSQLQPSRAIAKPYVFRPLAG